MPILGRGEQRVGPCTNPTEIDLLVAKPLKSVKKRKFVGQQTDLIFGKMMMRVLQYSSIARALSLSKSSTIHQATGAPRSTKFSCLQQQRPSLSHQLRKTQGEPLVFKTSAAKSMQYFSLTPTQRCPDFSNFYMPIPVPSMSQISSVAEWLMKQPTIALSPEVCHPMVDRPQEMKKIDEVLEKQSKPVKVLYLVGEPGAGKTQLARKYGVNYADSYTTSTKTVLTLDMRDFRANYCKLGIKLGLSHSVTNGQSLSNVAEEIKKILSARNYWLLIIDNYNSTDYEGFERGMPTTGILHNHSSYSTCLKLNSKYPSDKNELYN
jgi:hypothetical protein